MSLRKTSLVLACATLIGCGVAPGNQSEAFSDNQREEIEQIVRDYLIENPKVLEEMIAALEEERRVEAAANAQEGIRENSDALFSPDPVFVAGNPDGDVTVVEFFDYRCGYCRAAVDGIRKLLEEDGNVRLVLKEYPVLGPASLEAAQAAMAAARQGKYVEFHWALMELDEPINNDSIMRVAGQLGLDLNRLQEDMESDEIAVQLGENIQLAGELGINGTPNFIFGDTIVPGAIPYEAMVDYVKQARNGKDDS